MLLEKYSADEMFTKSLQIAVDKLASHGKMVYIIIDNPRLKHDINQYIGRPFKKQVDPELLRKDVLKEQLAYRSSLKNISGATIIETLDLFCPVDKCRTFSEQGLPFYKDQDHLSYAGSEFLAKEILHPVVLRNIGVK